MKFFILVLFAALAISQATPMGEELEVPEIDVNGMEAMEMLNGVRQRICTASLCHNMCRSLGWRTGSCNALRYCICRR